MPSAPSLFSKFLVGFFANLSYNMRFCMSDIRPHITVNYARACATGLSRNLSLALSHKIKIKLQTGKFSFNLSISVDSRIRSNIGRDLSNN